MKVNKILWSKLKQQHDILKMKTAYILAEKDIIADQSLTGWNKMDQKEMDAEMFYHLEGLTDLGQTKIYASEKDKIKAQMNELEETARKLLDQEKYELMQEAKEIWEELKKKYDRLK